MTTTFAQPLSAQPAARNSQTPEEFPVVVRRLAKKYGDLRAVNDISFSVRRGEVFGLLGPNGAGKTSTVEMIEGLRRPDHGEISVCGFNPVTEPNEVKQRLGVTLQSSALPDKIKVREALQLFGSFYRKRLEARKLMDFVALGEKAEATYDTLSGGQQQRLAIALALVNDPEVIVLDEPTTGLDPQTRRELYNLIEQLCSQNKTVLLTTHYIEEAEKLCDRVAVIDRGVIVALDSPAQLVATSRTHARIAFRTAQPVATGELRQIPFVAGIAQEAGGTVLQSANAPQTLIELVKWLELNRVELLDLHVTRPTLEDVFIELTGRKLRE
ncbi:MAG: ABC transporter ATP-binding protein [Blastocatellia bacterium]|nr:ABC transporter ATP-binding protein [Blastocatellia bacterium]